MFVSTLDDPARTTVAIIITYYWAGAAPRTPAGLRVMTSANLRMLLCGVCAAAASSLAASRSVSARRTSPVPTVEVAPGVHLPMITMGGVVQPGYPDPSNYSLWLE